LSPPHAQIAGEVKVNQTQVEVSDLEVARRLAFLLAKGAHAAEQLAGQLWT